MSLAFDILRGAVPGGTRIVKGQGERENMGAPTNAGYDLARITQQHLAVPADVGVQMAITSSDAQDDIAGTGIQRVRLHLLDPDGVEFTQDHDLNGGTFNITPALTRFVNCIHATQVGSGGVSAGTVDLHLAGDATAIYSTLSEGNYSLVPSFMVPKGHTLYIMECFETESQSRRAKVRLRTTSHLGEHFPGVYMFKSNSYLNGTTSPVKPVLTKVPELAKVRSTVWPDAVGAEASGFWWGYLVPNT